MFEAILDSEISTSKHVLTTCQDDKNVAGIYFQSKGHMYTNLTLHITHTND